MSATLLPSGTTTTWEAAPDSERPTALFRNGHALILSSLATSGIGFLFWVLVAHSYPDAVVGRDSAAISAMTFLGGIAQFNLAGALVRFIPVAGKRTLRFVLGTYGISIATAMPLALGFIVLIPRFAPSLAFVRSGWLFVLWWAVATTTWAVFTLEDGVLTGLRRSTWVPVENVGFSVAKIAFVIPLASLAPKSGIYLAWSFATLATVIPTNLLIFNRAIPPVQRASTTSDISAAQIARYVPYDCLASMCWLAAMSLTPLIVIHRLGATVSAFFSLDWVTTYALYLVSINMGASMIVESALDNSTVRDHLRRVRIHLAKLLVPAVAALVIAAPLVLRLFGRSYAVGGATTLRLLALSALPFMISSTAMSALRVRRKTQGVFLLNAGICGVVLALVWALVPVYGVRGAAIAWLVAQSACAAVLLVIGDARITGSAHQSFGDRSATVKLWLARLFVKSGLPAVASPIRARRERIGVGHRFSTELAEVVKVVGDPSTGDGTDPRIERVFIPSDSDLSVVLLRRSGDAPFLAVKFPRTDRARADLETQVAIVAMLAGDERLGAWRDLLPRLRLIEGEQMTYAAEDATAGIDTRHLLAAAPSDTLTIAAAGIEVIAGLHGPTAVTDVPSADDLEKMIWAPLRTLSDAHPSGFVPGTQRRALEEIGERLNRAVEGKAVELSWTHGDFSPGNLLLTPGTYRPTAVLDWGQARPRGIPAIDVMWWLITTSALVNKRHLGAVVTELLSAPALQAGTIWSLGSGALERADLDHREVALWCWLGHIAGNLEKSRRFGRHPLWWAANVEPVLKTVAR